MKIETNYPFDLTIRIKTSEIESKLEDAKWNLFMNLYNQFEISLRKIMDDSDLGGTKLIGNHNLEFKNIGEITEIKLKNKYAVQIIQI